MVALKAHEADRFLKSPPKGIRLFLLYGTDPGAITERARALEDLALELGGGEEVLRIGSDELSDNPGRIVDEVNSASLFGGEPVISLRVLDGRHNVIGALTPVFERPPESSWLIVEAAELSPSSPLRKAFESSAGAAALPTYRLEGKGLTAMITAAAKEAGLAIGEDALELLAANLGGDRLAVRGELEKLFLYAREGKISVADVLAIVGDIGDAETDELIDAALLGESERLETGLGRLRAESGSFGSLGTLMLRHLVTLQTLRAAVDGGKSASDVIDYARPPIFRTRRANVVGELERWPSEKLRDARREIDQAVYDSRRQGGIEDIAISAALHRVALTARKLKRDSAS
jgi:DNA polymerase-3 subunit delta